MGNSLSYNTNDDYNSPVYKHKGNNIDPNHQNNLLRKFIQNELMNRKEVINGNEVDINKLKVFCRNTRENEQASDFKAVDNDIINLSLPYVTNTAPLFSDSDKNNLQIKTEIKTAYVPFNYNGSDDIKITHNGVDNVTFSQQHCDNYIGAICGKQVFDNNCVINTNIVADSTDKSLSIDPNNSKCFKDKTENNRFDDRAYTRDQKQKILEKLSDMAYDVNNNLLERNVHNYKEITQDTNNFADYITSNYHLVDYLKAPWNDAAYNSPSTPGNNYLSIQLSANQAGEPVYAREDNVTKIFYPNTDKGNEQGYIILRKDFSDYQHWTDKGKYFKNQQDTGRYIFSFSDFHNKKESGEYTPKQGETDYSNPYLILPRDTESQEIFSDQDQNYRIHCYFNLRRMVILNYIYVNELIIKPPNTSDKVFNTGEPICNCVNSPYGPNFQKVTNTSCLGKLANLDYEGLKSLADSNNPLAAEARRCMGWNVKYLTNYKYQSSNFVLSNNTKGSAMNIQEALNMIKDGRATIDEKVDGIADLDTNTKNMLKTQISQVFNDENNGVQFIEIQEKDQAINNNYIIQGTGKPTDEGHNYQINLDKKLYDIGDSGDTTQGGLIDYFISAQDKDMVCQTSIIKNKTGNRPEQAPYYYTPNRKDGDVTCVNSISFNNISVETLNIGSILQNNTCGNVGNIQQTFISEKPGVSDNRSACARGILRSYLYITGFTVGVTTAEKYPKLINSLDSNLNGVYKFDESATNANKDGDNSPYQIYRNMRNQNMMLVIHISTVDNVSKASAKFYINYLGNQISIINSREFNFTSGNRRDNEELCMELNSTVLGLLLEDLNSINNLNGEKLYNSDEQEEKFNNFYEKSSEYNDVNDFKDTSTQKGGAILPDYSWVPQLEYVNATSSSDKTNFQRFLNSRTGLISTGYQDNFTLNAGTKPFFNRAETNMDEVRTLYLEEVSDSLNYEAIGNSKPIFGKTKVYTTAEDLEAAGVIYDAEEPESVMDWKNQTRATEGVFEEKTYTHDSKDAESKSVFNFKFDRVGAEKSFICYNPTLQRYILIYKPTKDSYKIMGASDITNRSLSKLEKDIDGFNTITFSSRLLKNLPLNIYKNQNERANFFTWQEKPMQLVEDWENVDRKWTLKNFSNYTDSMENLDNIAKIPSKITFNLVSNLLQPGQYTNSQATHNSMLDIFKNPIYQPNKISKTTMKDTYKDKLDEFRKLRFVIDMYGELGKNTDIQVQTDSNIPHAIKGLNYERLTGRKYTFGRRRYEDNKPDEENIFTFENGKWVLKRPRNDQEDDFTGPTYNGNEFQGDDSSQEGKDTVRLEFNTLNIISATESIIDLDFASNLLGDMKVNIMPTSEYYLELCFNKLGFKNTNGTIGINDVNDGTSDDEVIKAPWKEIIDQSFVENKSNFTSYATVVEEVKKLIINKMQDYFEKLKKIRLSTDITSESAKIVHSSLLTQTGRLSFNSDGYGKNFVKDDGKYFTSLHLNADNIDINPLIDRYLVKIETSAGAKELQQLNIHEMMGYVNSSLNIVNLENPKTLRQFLLKVGVIDTHNYNDSLNGNVELNEKPYNDLVNPDGELANVELKLCDNTTHYELKDNTESDYFNNDNSIFKNSISPRLHSNSFIVYSTTNMGMNGGMKVGQIKLKTTLSNLKVVTGNVKGLEDEIKTSFDYALNSTFSKFGCTVQLVDSPEGFNNIKKINRIEGFSNSNYMYNFIENLDNTGSNYKEFLITYLYYVYKDSQQKASKYFPAITDDEGKKIENSAIEISAFENLGIITPEYKKGYKNVKNFLTKNSGVGDDGYNTVSKQFHKLLFTKINSGKDTFDTGHLELTVTDDIEGVEKSIYSTENDPYLEAVKTISLTTILRRIDISFNLLVNKITAFKDTLLLKYDNVEFNTPISQYFENVAPGTTNEGILNFIQNDYNAKKGSGISGLMQLLQNKSGKTTWDLILNHEFTNEQTLEIQGSQYYNNFVGAVQSIEGIIYSKGLDVTNELTEKSIIENGILDRRIKDYHRQINKRNINVRYNITLTDEQNIVANEKCAVAYNFDSPNDTNTCAEFEKTILIKLINDLLTEIAAIDNTMANSYTSKNINVDRAFYQSKKEELAVKIASKNKPDPVTEQPEEPRGDDTTDPDVPPKEVGGSEPEPEKSNMIFIVIGIVLLLAIVAFFVLRGNTEGDYNELDGEYDDIDYDDYGDGDYGDGEF